MTLTGGFEHKQYDTTIKKIQMYFDICIAPNR